MTQPAISQRIYARDVELAERYGVTRNTIWRWARNGLLPSPVQLSPGCTRWLLSEIEQREAEQNRAGRG